jgi:Cu(I)/Ag(I) efflux system membrane protein CusA/SilA
LIEPVILVFLWHVRRRSSDRDDPLRVAGVHSSIARATAIMSLAGIAISIGVLVDGAIVEVENAYKRIEQWIAAGRQGDVHAVRLRALEEVGPSVFFSLLVIAVSFLPVFTLVDQEGRLFKPLAYSKNLAMFIAALLAITLDPALRMLFTRVDPIVMRPAWLGRLATSMLVGRYVPEERHPVSRVLFRAYEPVCRWVLRHRMATLVAALLLMASTVPAFLRLGSEFMPPLHEGAFLYMPTALPGMSVTEAQRVLQIQDRAPGSLRGGACPARPAAPRPPPILRPPMVETTVVLKPERKAARRHARRRRAEMDAAIRVPACPTSGP